MLRKHLLTDQPAERVPEPGEKDIEALATVWVTSEAPDYPIDHAFDSHRGPGGSRWVAGTPGPQRLLLVSMLRRPCACSTLRSRNGT